MALLCLPYRMHFLRWDLPVWCLLHVHARHPDQEQLSVSCLGRCRLCATVLSAAVAMQQACCHGVWSLAVWGCQAVVQFVAALEQLLPLASNARAACKSQQFASSARASSWVVLRSHPALLVSCLSGSLVNGTRRRRGTMRQQRIKSRMALKAASLLEGSIWAGLCLPWSVYAS